MNYVELMVFGLICVLLGLSGFLSIQSWTNARQKHCFYLALFYSCIFVTTFLNDLYMELSVWKHLPWLMKLYMPVMFLIAPTYYLYVRQLTNPNDPVTNREWGFHLFGLILVIGLCVPYWLLDSTVKLDRLQAADGTLQHLGVITLGPVIAFLLVILFACVYLSMAFRLLKRHVTNIKQLFSNIENKDLSWLRWSILVLCLALLSSIFQIFDVFGEESSANYLSVYFFIIEIVWLSIIGVLSIKQKPIYTEEKKQLKADKYVRSKVSKEEIEKISHKLKVAMEQDKLYQNPDLTLRHLSDQIKSSENKISQVLNSNLQQGFYDFVNSWRIKQACHLMRTQKLNILEIAYEVGFNSRSTFNNAFKKHIQKTPSQYKKEINASD